jgi:FKBP12-rapamycin complex-associated protein
VQFYELRNVAPKLLTSENLQIAVPGTFRSGYRITRIAKFSSVLPVFQSKQHPRKMSLMGDDGREYVFVLKGHEDIRQDERVMQLFGLVNTLLSIDPMTCKKNLSIRRYPIIPLSHQAGLIGLVPNSDTLNQLIKEHRLNSDPKLVFNAETKAMEKMYENYDSCPLLNKVEIFRYAQNNTAGEDLQRMLWLKSQNSELWLERRTNYTRSLAVMSMVGYILGLGDRHPSNIMLDRFSGKIFHIDFGDCFEVAMRRDKFPEKIPFRLTRMLQKAMEISTIEGNYRNTCENTMRVMRDNKDSLLAILEAFVYDPLLSFRLLNLTALINQKKKAANEEDIIAAPQVEMNEGGASQIDKSTK